MTLDGYRTLTYTYWIKKYQPVTNNTTKDKNAERYRLGINSIFVPDKRHFKLIE